MDIILSKASETIKSLKEATGLPVYIKRRLPLSLGTVIRWGSIREADCVNEYNTVEAIKLVSNKPKCRRFLEEYDIPVPHSGTDLFPCIGRPKYHTGGENFFFCRTPEDVERAKRQGAVYFSQYFPKQREFRVHVGKLDGRYKVILYSEKIGDKFGGVIWNHDIGNFKFVHMGRGERRLDVIGLAKEAIEAVELDFGCVDILADPLYRHLPPVVVCEINTAPALSEYGVQKYAEYFEELLNEHR